jgi:serine/threonine-protein kinase RsbW
MSGTNDVDLGAVSLTVPRRPEFLRLVRLAAADSGARADLSIEDVEDLRIAVDELTYALMGEDAADDAADSAPLTLRFAVSPGVVEIEGSGEAVGETAPLSELSRNIISAVVDEYDLADEGGVRRFRLVKRSQT